MEGSSREVLPEPLVIWTRAADQWADDIALWQAQGPLLPWSIPSLKSQAVEWSQRPSQSFWDSISQQVLIITSPRAVEIMAQDESLRKLLFQATARITHGPATAQALRLLGLPVAGLPVAGRPMRSGAELASWIAENIPQTKPLVFVSPQEAAFDFQSFLTSKGFQIERLVCYKTLPGIDSPYLERLRYLAFNKKQNWVLCFASPSAVKGFVSECQQQQWPLPQPKGVAVIGPTTAREAGQYFTNITVAPVNSIKDLIQTALRFFSAPFPDDSPLISHKGKP